LPARGAPRAPPQPPAPPAPAVAAAQRDELRRTTAALQARLP